MWMAVACFVAVFVFMLFAVDMKMVVCVLDLQIGSPDAPKHICETESDQHPCGEVTSFGFDAFKFSDGYADSYSDKAENY